MASVGQDENFLGSRGLFWGEFLARAGVRHEVIARVLNHSPARIMGSTAVYARHTFEREVGEALELWNSHLHEVLPPVGHVIPIVGTPEQVLSETVAL